MDQRMNPTPELAWAAGLFDGEGSVSTYVPRHRRSPRRQMQISQAGPPGKKPLVLVRFQEIVGGLGNITGPYRGYLYYWKITKKDEVDEVGDLLWPYLGQEKRRQFATAALRITRTTPGPVESPHLPDPILEASWAAGLFDGERTISLVRRPPRREPAGVAMSLPQASSSGVPEKLLRFRAAVAGVGGIGGPYAPRSPWPRLPHYQWATGDRHKVTTVARILWPSLGAIKRRSLSAAATFLDPDFQEWSAGRIQSG